MQHCIDQRILRIFVIMQRITEKSKAPTELHEFKSVDQELCSLFKNLVVFYLLGYDLSFWLWFIFLDVDDEEDNSNSKSNHYDCENDFSRYTVYVDDSREGDYQRTNNLDDNLSGTSSRDGNKTYLRN